MTSDMISDENSGHHSDSWRPPESASRCHHPFSSFIWNRTHLVKNRWIRWNYLSYFYTYITYQFQPQVRNMKRLAKNVKNPSRRKLEDCNAFDHRPDKMFGTLKHWESINFEQLCSSMLQVQIVACMFCRVSCGATFIKFVVVDSTLFGQPACRNFLVVNFRICSKALYPALANWKSQRQTLLKWWSMARQSLSSEQRNQSEMLQLVAQTESSLEPLPWLMAPVKSPNTHWLHPHLLVFHQYRSICFHRLSRLPSAIAVAFALAKHQGSHHGYGCAMTAPCAALFYNFRFAFGREIWSNPVRPERKWLTSDDMATWLFAAVLLQPSGALLLYAAKDCRKTRPERIPMTSWGVCAAVSNCCQLRRPCKLSETHPSNCSNWENQKIRFIELMLWIRNWMNIAEKRPWPPQIGTLLTTPSSHCARPRCELVLCSKLFKLPAMRWKHWHWPWWLS